jgi:hypothetical protein
MAIGPNPQPSIPIILYILKTFYFVLFIYLIPYYLKNNNYIICRIYTNIIISKSNKSLLLNIPCTIIYLQLFLNNIQMTLFLF